MCVFIKDSQKFHSDFLGRNEILSVAIVAQVRCKLPCARRLRKGILCEQMVKGLASSFDDPLVLLHRGPQISQRGLASVLKHVKRHGLPPASSRQSQQRKRREAVISNTPYGPVLQALRLTLPSGPWETWLSHPCALLYRTAKDCEPFRSLLRKKLHQHPCSVQRPWHLIIYFD